MWLKETEKHIGLQYAFCLDYASAEHLETSKEEILKNINDGVKSPELGPRTALHIQCRKDCIGYLPLQKLCFYANNEKHFVLQNWMETHIHTFFIRNSVP